MDLEGENLELARRVRQLEDGGGNRPQDNNAPMSPAELSPSPSKGEYRRQRISAHGQIELLAELSTADEMALQRWGGATDSSAASVSSPVSRGRAGARRGSVTFSDKDKKALEMWGV